MGRVQAPRALAPPPLAASAAGSADSRYVSRGVSRHPFPPHLTASLYTYTPQTFGFVFIRTYVPYGKRNTLSTSVFAKQSYKTWPVVMGEGKGRSQARQRSRGEQEHGAAARQPELSPRPGLCFLEETVAGEKCNGRQWYGDKPPPSASISLLRHHSCPARLCFPADLPGFATGWI